MKRNLKIYVSVRIINRKPNFKEAFIGFIQEQGLSIDENFVFSDSGKPYINADGYTGINSKISLPTLSLVVSVSAYQHDGWDFYFNSVSEM